MRNIALAMLLFAVLPAHAATQCQGSVIPAPLPVRPTLLAPVASGFVAVNPQLGSQRGVLAQGFDEAQSVDNVLQRLRIEGCQNVAASVPAAAAPVTASAAAYVKRTEHDNTPYRFNMTQGGKRMTADDFDAWLKANGYSAGRRVDPNAAAAQPDASETPAQPQQ